MTGSKGLIAIDKVGNAIRFYDPVTLGEIKRIDAPEPCVHELAMAPDRRSAFVPLYGDGIYGSNKHPNNTVMVIDLDTQETRDIIDLGQFFAPHGMVATSDGKLWVACDLSNTLLLIDPGKRAIEATYTIPGKGSHLIAALPDERKLYLSNKEGDLAVFDFAKRAVVTIVPMGAPGVVQGNGSGSEGVAASPDGTRVLVADNDRSELHVIDTSTDREIDRVALIMNALSNVKRSRLIRLSFSPDGAYVIATNYASGLAWVIDGSDYRRQTLVTVAKGPQGAAFAADGKTALVANHDSGLITQIDLASKRAVAVYDGGAGIEVLSYY